MVKTDTSKENTLSENNLLDLFKSFYDFKIFENKTKIQNLILYSAIFIFLIILINGIFYTPLNNNFNLISTLISVFLGIPIILFFIYLLFIIFLNAFESKKKSFFEAYLVFISQNLPFWFILTLISRLFSNTINPILLNLFSILILATLIYYGIYFINNYKNYYQTSSWKVLASSLIVFCFSLIIFLTIYVAYLVSGITQ